MAEPPHPGLEAGRRRLPPQSSDADDDRERGLSLRSPRDGLYARSEADDIHVRRERPLGVEKSLAKSRDEVQEGTAFAAGHRSRRLILSRLRNALERKGSLG